VAILVRYIEPKKCKEGHNRQILRVVWPVTFTTMNKSEWLNMPKGDVDDYRK